MALFTKLSKLVERRHANDARLAMSIYTGELPDSILAGHTPARAAKIRRLVADLAKKPAVNAAGFVGLPEGAIVGVDLVVSGGNFSVTVSPDYDGAARVNPTPDVFAVGRG